MPARSTSPMPGASNRGVSRQPSVKIKREALDDGDNSGSRPKRANRGTSNPTNTVQTGPSTTGRVGRAVEVAQGSLPVIQPAAANNFLDEIVAKLNELVRAQRMSNETHKKDRETIKRLQGKV